MIMDFRSLALECIRKLYSEALGQVTVAIGDDQIDLCSLKPLPPVHRTEMVSSRRAGSCPPCAPHNSQGLEP